MKFGVGNPCRKKRPIVEMSVEIIFPFGVRRVANFAGGVVWSTLESSNSCIFCRLRG
jgi:hypothetical protein